MLWAALLLPVTDDALPSRNDLLGLAAWAQQFTPRVAIVDEAVVIEVEASVRLFRGRRALRDRVHAEGTELGVMFLAWAATSLGALALGRAGIENGFRKPLPELLDSLHLLALSAVKPHLTTLSHLGCKTLGDIRALPRGGISRRFDKELLFALDQAYGEQPEAHEWILPAETFKSRLELMARVDLAPALLFGARRLLLQMTGWLTARHCGTSAFVLRWAHDCMRSKDAGTGGEMTIRTAAATRDIEHLCRLLAENLAKTQLLAAVGDLELEALDVVPLEEKSGSLLPDAEEEGESLALVLERIAARIGPENVLRPVLCEDHRLEWAQVWQPAPEKLPKKRRLVTRTPQPAFVLPEPLRLHTAKNRPMYQGPLQLLTGPHRVEGGWWHRTDEGSTANNVQRDYWVALSEHAGVLWIYQERLAKDETAWFLHGTFA